MEGKVEEVEGDEPGGTITETWLNKHREIYTKATRHPFIVSIRDGTVNLSSFKQWLGQDYIFVREFIPLMASVLLKAWKESDDGSDMEVLLGGMASLNDEISWFKKEASKWGIFLSGISPQKANQDYCRFLESLISPEVNYTVAITAFWVIEAVYQESFSLCLRSGSNTPAELMETCQRWGNDSFGQYCFSLQKIANRNLAKAPADVLREAEEAFLRVLELEVGFWSMSHGEGWFYCSHMAVANVQSRYGPFQAWHKAHYLFPTGRYPIRKCLKSEVFIKFEGKFVLTQVKDYFCMVGDGSPMIRNVSPQLIGTPPSKLPILIITISRVSKLGSLQRYTLTTTMATTLSGVSLSTTVVGKAESGTRVQTLRSPCLNNPWRSNHFKVGRMSVRTMVAPDSISEKVSKSIEAAKETCAEDPVSGECAAAWDEVEEVSAAASDARLKKKEADADPLEVYCKDNPETDECRTYDD